MRPTHRTTLQATLLPLLFLLAGAEPAPTPMVPDGPFGLTGPLDSRYDALREASLRADLQVPVADQTVYLGPLRLLLIEGAILPLATRGDVVVGGVFRGTCSLSYRAPGPIETEAFRRGTSREAWDEEPCGLALFQTDDAELLERLGLSTLPESGDAPPPLDAEQTILVDDFLQDSSLPAAALARHLGASAGGSPSYELQVQGPDFGTPVRVDDDKPLQPLNVVAAMHSPLGLYHESEGLVLMGLRRFGAGKYLRMLNSHPLDAAPPPVAPPPSLQVMGTDLNLELDWLPTERFVRMDAVATLRVRPHQRPMQALWLSLEGGAPDDPREPGKRERLLASAVEDASGALLPFVHRDGRLLVWLPQPLPVGEETTLVVRYAGQGVAKEGLEHFGLFANWAWLPSGPGRTRMDWRAKVCMPEGPRMAATGRLVEETVALGRRCETHEAATPVNFPAMNLGWWDTGARETPNRTLRAWFDRDYRVQIQPALEATEHILQVYEGFFGPLPHQEIDIAQGRDHRGFWQAPDGLVEMSAGWNSKGLSAFKVTPRDWIEDFSSYILAHELAHQYWGHVVTYPSYRDQWISESFADYSAYLYMVWTNGGAGHSGWWRNSSVWAGRRGVVSLGSRNGGLYQPLVYSRGPLVLHMFRRMVGDEAFFAWMRTLVQVGRDRPVSTEDLIIIAEHVTGQDARWFFEQWLRNPGVPNLAATWREEGGEVRLTLEQSGTDTPLRLQVPVRLVGKRRGRTADYVVNTDAASIEVTLPAPKGGVKSVELDPDDGMIRDEAKVKHAE